MQDASRSIILLAHNIRSLWNVGSFFRTADALQIERIILSGYTALPPRREIHKTGLGAEEWISWEHADEPMTAIDRYRSEGYRIVALEQDPKAIALESYAPQAKTLLIVGNEISGVPRDLLDRSDDIVQIGMHGKKESLNVAVATGIAVWHLRARTQN
jgi:23S rRNA (guanosine2251-2'-O)-methyltransferase